MTPKICVLNEREASLLREAGIAYRCSSGRHRHYSRKAVEELVQRGEMEWIGQHKKIAAWSQARTWKKTYNRNHAGEVSSVGMQLVRGGG